MVSTAELNTTRQVLEQGMPALLTLLQSPEIAQPLEWNLPLPAPQPPPGPPVPLTWQCEIGRCIGVGRAAGGDNSTGCNGHCAALAQDEWLANLNYWTATPELLVAKEDTELKKATTESTKLPPGLKRAVKKGDSCRRKKKQTGAPTFENYVVCVVVSKVLLGATSTATFHDVPVDVSSSSAAAPAVQRFEPGGWGAFPALTRHPSNPAVWVAGADVGGLFVTQDDAQTWAVCNAGLATRWIYGIEFVDDTTPLLATTAGIYRGKTSAAAGPCLWEFTLSNEGLRLSNTTQNMQSSRFEFRHSVRVLHSTATHVWAGIGIAKNRATMGTGARTGDPFHLYVSNDGGQRWRGVLTLPQGAGQVMSISSGAIGVRAGRGRWRRQQQQQQQQQQAAPESIFISTATKGSYVTDDFGESWVEIGVSPAMVTHSAGQTWGACTSATCPLRFASKCDPHAIVTSAGCLPINAKQNETHPNTATVTVTGGKVFVTIFDTSEADPALLGQCTGGGEVRTDPSLKQYRGGAWMSEDGGVSFIHLFRTFPFTGAALRCPGVSVHYSTPNFPNVEVDPADPTHLFLGGWGSAGPGQGLHELVGGKWIYWDWCGGNSSDKSCFEGERPDSMLLDFNTYTFAFGVDWESSEQRVITNGKIMPLPPSTGTTNEATAVVGRHPLPFFTTSRGGIRAAWDPVNLRYSFKHLNNDIVSMNAVPAPSWRSTGM